MYYFHQLSNLWVRALCCYIMSEDSERKSHKGSAGWIIVGIVAGLAVIFIVVIAFSSTLFPSGPGTGGPRRLQINPRQAVLGIILLLQAEMCPRKLRMKRLLTPALRLSKSQTQKSLLGERRAL